MFLIHSSFYAGFYYCIVSVILSPSPHYQKKRGRFRVYGYQSKRNRPVNTESWPFTWHLRIIFFQMVSNIFEFLLSVWEKGCYDPEHIIMNISYTNEDYYYRNVLLIVHYLSGWSQTSTGGRQMVPATLMMSLHVPSPTHWEVLIQLEDGWDDWQEYGWPTHLMKIP